MTRPTNLGRSFPRVSSLGPMTTDLGDLADVDITGIADGDIIIWDDASQTWIVGTPSSGSVATDPIWDAKGDLAAGTGADAAAKLTVGANDTILMADSGQTTGLKWVASQTPSDLDYDDVAAQGTADTFARGDHVHGMPSAGGGGGLTQAYVGYNAIGGTQVGLATSRWVMKKITLANACLVTSIEMYVQATADAEFWVRAAMWDDTAGNPEHVIGATFGGSIVPEETGSGPRDARWFNLPMGRWCTAGDYWIGFSPNATNLNVFYDGSGSDREFTAGNSSSGMQVGDYGLWTPSTTTRNYSLRANTIR